MAELRKRNHRNLMRYSQDEFGRSWPQPFYSLQEIMTRRAQKKTWKLVSNFGELDDLVTCMTNTNNKVTDLPKIKIDDSNFAVLKW